MRKIILLAIVIAISGCGSVLKNPEIKNTEFKKELAKQTVLLNAYKKKYKGSRATRKRFSSFYEYDAFFSEHTDRILKSSVDFCKYKMNSAGLQFSQDQTINVNKLPQNLDGYPQVYGVTRSHLAETAGVKKGDLIIKFNGKDSRSADIYKMYMDIFTNPSNTMTVYNSNTKHNKKVILRGQDTCAMITITERKKLYNAYATGNEVHMFPSLMDFLQKDEYVISVLSHEIAHNMMAHMRRSNNNMAVGKLLGLALSFSLGWKVDSSGTRDVMNLGGQLSKVYSPEFEAEADYLSIYLLARAGYNIDSISGTWRRMALLESNPDNLQKDTSHPAKPKRFIAMQKTILEVKEKIAKGEPLIPIFKESNFNDIKNMQPPLFE